MELLFHRARNQGDVLWRYWSEEGPERALIRILAKVKRQSFNSLEVTGIVANRFLGVPYATVSAHSRQIQETCRLGGRRRTASVSARQRVG